mgnify:FL=1
MNKKILFICTIVILCIGSVVSAATSFSDVKNTKYEEAVENLVSLKIVNGFEDNTFKPKNNVTRAQLSKMLVISMGMEDEVTSAGKKFLNFNDVLSSYWGYGYIKVASDKKLVKGYTDGKFKPDGTVTYAEATAMVVRALGYEDVIKKSSLTWPNNYMSYANDNLKLFNGISTFKANDTATRGDIALLLWNALRTGVCDIVGENSNGLIYGQGTPMISVYLGYTYIKDAEITKIDFDDELESAEVTLKDDKKETYKYTFDVDDALNMYGRKVTVLLDKKTNKILSLDANTTYTVVKGEVTRVSETKIYLSNRKTGYKIPKEENILLVGIEDIEDTVEAIILLDGATPAYCICRGATDVKVGIVVDANAKVTGYKETGIKVRDVGSTKGGKSYLLADDELKISKNDTILYYINADDMLVVLRMIDELDADDVTSVTKNSIKVNKNTYKFGDTTEYSVIFVGSSKLTNKKLTDIDEDFDAVNIIVYNGHTYIFVFQDAGGDDIDSDVKEAYRDLVNAIEDALDEYDEENYTQDSYGRFMKAIYAGQRLNYESKVDELTKAVTKIENAIDNLEEVTDRTERKVVKAKKKLRALVDQADEIIADDKDYTTKTYDVFLEAYDIADDLLGSYKAELKELLNAYDDLSEAIDGLKEKASSRN